MNETRKQSIIGKLLSYVLFFLKLLACFVMLNLLAVFYSVKCVLTGEKIWRRMAIPMFYGGMVASYFFMPKVFCVLLGVILFAEICMAVYIVSGKAETIGKQKESAGHSTDDNRSESSITECLDEFSFDGLSIEDANKKFKQLMKKYHPDNAGGDVEKAKVINLAYEKYRARYSN